MKFPAFVLGLLPAALLAAAPITAPPAPPPAPPAPPAAPAPLAPASDYTNQSIDPPLVPEYDPATAPPPAFAEPSDDDGTRECVGPHGEHIFTDRRCGDLGATPQLVLPPIGTAVPGQPLRVRSCARNQGALLDGVRAALESHDANRLADYYHWTGMGSAEGYRLMDRLAAFSARPVVDVQLVRTALPDEAEPDLFENRFDPPPPGLDDPAAIDPAGVEPGAPEGAAPPRRPRRLASMLRVDQMRSDDDVASTITYFHLLTNAGCWWMRF